MSEPTVAADVVRGVSRIRRGRCDRTRAPALRRAAAEVDRQRQLLPAVDVPDRPRHRLADGTDQQRLAEATHPAGRRPGVQTGVPGGRRPGFVKEVDLERAEY